MLFPSGFPRISSKVKISLTRTQFYILAELPENLGRTEEIFLVSRVESKLALSENDFAISVKAPFVERTYFHFNTQSNVWHVVSPKGRKLGVVLLEILPDEERV